MTYYIVDCRTKKKVEKFETRDGAWVFISHQSKQYQITHNIVNEVDE